MRGLKIIFGQQIQLKWNHFLLRIELLNFHCVIDIFTKCGWVKSLKVKNGKTVLNAYMEIVNESNCKPNKQWENDQTIMIF